MVQPSPPKRARVERSLYISETLSTTYDAQPGEHLPANLASQKTAQHLESIVGVPVLSSSLEYLGDIRDASGNRVQHFKTRALPGFSSPVAKLVSQTRPASASSAESSATQVAQQQQPSSDEGGSNSQQLPTTTDVMYLREALDRAKMDTKAQQDALGKQISAAVEATRVEMSSSVERSQRRAEQAAVRAMERALERMQVQQQLAVQQQASGSKVEEPATVEERLARMERRLLPMQKSFASVQVRMLLELWRRLRHKAAARRDAAGKLIPFDEANARWEAYTSDTPPPEEERTCAKWRPYQKLGSCEAHTLYLAYLYESLELLGLCEDPRLMAIVERVTKSPNLASLLMDPDVHIDMAGYPPV